MTQSLQQYYSLHRLFFKEIKEEKVLLIDSDTFIFENIEHFPESYKDFDFVMNKMMAGWQPNEHEFTSDIIDHIAIHEMDFDADGELWFVNTKFSCLSKQQLNFSFIIIYYCCPSSN